MDWNSGKESKMLMLILTEFSAFGFANKRFEPGIELVIIAAGLLVAGLCFWKGTDYLWTGKNISALIYATIGIFCVFFCGMFLLWNA